MGEVEEEKIKQLGRKNGIEIEFVADHRRPTEVVFSSFCFFFQIFFNFFQHFYLKPFTILLECSFRIGDHQSDECSLQTVNLIDKIVFMNGFECLTRFFIFQLKKERVFKVSFPLFHFVPIENLQKTHKKGRRERKKKKELLLLQNVSFISMKKNN